MLGTLPSKYLKWVSKTLRARDFEEWAKLADEVLQDPVYKDRLEWELAEITLNGDKGNGISGRNGSAVSDLLDISERFGWDNEDKIGWSRIDFALLGTSKGGRIPRKSSSRVSDQMEEMGSSNDEDSRVDRERKLGVLNKSSSRVLKKMGYSSDEDSRVHRERKLGSFRGSQLKKMGYSNAEDSRVFQMEEMGYHGDEGSRVDREKKLGFLSTGTSRVSVEAEEVVVEGRRVRESREERRERQRLKRGLQMHKVRLEIGSNKKKENRDKQHLDQNQDKDLTVDRISSPFPGRETLLKKVLNKERVL
ncbi:hypothetical protein BVC80_521g11 [Macleaya cordata]|uniref:Uncharacterized protein n=1 Tax=Macleaya cordata TaxID=56857 RepID=A0A200R967_MACCD|nr:hypothetical protein BVC80_521g11 [Macleaya cordata]